LAWLDVSRFLGTTLEEKNGKRFPDTVPMLVKLSSEDGSSLAAGEFATLVVPRKDVLDYRAGAMITLPDGTFAKIASTPTIGLPRNNNGIEVQFMHVPNQLIDQATHAPNKPIIAVIDDGCPFARIGLRDGTTTRVLRLLDQDSDGLPHSSKPFSGRGSEWDRPALNAALAAGIVAGAPSGTIDEDRCYAYLEMDLVGETFRHGAHMLGLAVGDPDPWRDDNKAEPLDAASQADILFVHLPRATITDTSGGSLPGPLREALDWIDEHTIVKGPTGMAEIPVVINLSIGASAGPHDGSSEIEQMLSTFLAKRKYAIIVAAAGNARGQRQHASWQVNPNQTVSVPWDIAIDDGTDNHMELWWTDTGGGPGFLEVQLVPPGGDPDKCPFIRTGDAKFIFDRNDPTQPAIAGVGSIESKSVPLAKGGARVVLLSVAPTAPDGQADRPLALAGTWLVRTRISAGGPVQVDAWIERDDADFGARATPSVFGDAASTFMQEHSTASNLANADNITIVGGYEFDPLHPRQGPFDEHAGEGRGRRGYGRSGPDLAAPSTHSGGGIEGVLSWGVHSGEWLRLAGTSAATAAMTRRIYNHWVAYGTPLPHGAQITASFAANVPRSGPEPVTRVGRGRVIP
jgi:Subtilase family